MPFGKVTNLMFHLISKVVEHSEPFWLRKCLPLRVRMEKYIEEKFARAGAQITEDKVPLSVV